MANERRFRGLFTALADASTRARRAAPALSFRLAVLALSSLLGACGGDGTKPQPPKVASVVVSPSALLLTGSAEDAELRAQALDDAGKPLPDAHVTWKSARPDDVAVDADGRVTAATRVGSSTIVAVVD